MKEGMYYMKRTMRKEGEKGGRGGGGGGGKEGRKIEERKGNNKGNGRWEERKGWRIGRMPKRQLFFSTNLFSPFSLPPIICCTTAQNRPFSLNGLPSSLLPNSPAFLPSARPPLLLSVLPSALPPSRPSWEFLDLLTTGGL
jgi:hypothetical protein